MFSQTFSAVVDFSRKHALVFVIAAFLISLGLGAYTAKNISINTDINQLLSENLDWRKREKALEDAFPQKVDTLVVVIDSENGAKAEQAAKDLAEVLAAKTDQFTSVTRPDALPFFRANGLLYLSKDDLSGVLNQITQAQPMLGAITSDPSLRGFFGTIGMMLQGFEAGAVDPAQLERPLREIAAVIDAAVKGQDRPLNWANMMPAESASNAAREKRKYIVTKPLLDYASLQPGAAASATIRQAVADLKLTPENDVRVRLTGSVPLNDDEFASVSEGAGLSTALCGAFVFVLLFLAMRTARIVVPITLTLIVGLIASTAFATFAVGSLNLISVAFAVMFIGIAVDFGIQFGVRYRDEHSREPDHTKALRNTASIIAPPLAMAAGSTALGFLAFTPTDYRGVSELGLIAGAGMIIAFVLNITLLPALMTLMRPPAETESIGFQKLAPLNAFLTGNRKILMPIVGIIALVCIILDGHVRFDFDPLDLKDPKMESVTTMFEAMQDPDSDAYAAQILVPSEEEAARLSDALSALPEVDHVMTLNSFVPEDQVSKLAMIADSALLLEPTFALPAQPAPSDAENIETLRKTAELLHEVKDRLPAAQSLAESLTSLSAQRSVELLARAQKNILAPMQAKMGEIRTLLAAKTVTRDDIPPELKRDWIAEDGQRLIEVFPKRGADNNPRDPQMLTRFIDAVQAVAPTAAGAPVSIRESGRTIISAFVHAGIYGIVSIAILSLIVLRRVRDVFHMLTPLVLAGILTLATIGFLDMPLNFANIIALPLLFSLGVSYAVYFVFFAQQGRRDFLQSSMARAVLFSACTVLVAFLALCFSSHPGTRSMGELLTIALLYSLACTFLLLPVLCSQKKEDKR